jgi:hypothetical protein
MGQLDKNKIPLMVVFFMLTANGTKKMGNGFPWNF